MKGVSNIIQTFQEKINNDNEYSLKELMRLLTESYNENKPKKTKSDVKRPSSAYNNFVRETIIQLKKDKPDVVAKELMSIAASKWKGLSQEEKDKYKSSEGTK